MKPARFTYSRPDTVQAAIDVLGDASDDGRVLAGGQSLVPVMAFRLATPAHVIDINRISELDYVTLEEGHLRVGATTRHARFHQPVAAGPLGSLLTFVSHHIAHWPIRTRGTFCGSLAHADPASEWCLVLSTLDGSVIARSRANGARNISCDALFQWAMTTNLEPDELLTEARLPLLGEDVRWGFYEFSRRAGDYAIAMALVAFSVVDGVIAQPRIGVGAVEVKPRRIGEAEAAIAGVKPTAAAFEEAANIAAATVEPMEDAQADGDFRRELTRVAVRRALERAVE